MKNTVGLQVILALLIAYCVASFVRHDGDKFIDSTDINNSSNGTFFWVHTFNLGKSSGLQILNFLVLSLPCNVDKPSSAHFKST